MDLVKEWIKGLKYLSSGLTYYIKNYFCMSLGLAKNAIYSIL